MEKGGKKKSVKKCISENRESLLKSLFPEWGSRVGGGGGGSLSALSFAIDTLDSACTNSGVVWTARSMDVMVCTSEWQEGCLSCSSSSGYWHLSPSVFHLPPLPASGPRLPNIHLYALAHTTHTVLAQSPHFQSISATYLSHHSNCSQ